MTALSRSHLSNSVTFESLAFYMFLCHGCFRPFFFAQKDIIVTAHINTAFTSLCTMLSYVFVPFMVHKHVKKLYHDKKHHSHSTSFCKAPVGHRSYYYFSESTIIKGSFSNSKLKIHIYTGVLNFEEICSSRLVS